MRNDDEGCPGTTDRAAVLRALADHGSSGGCGFRVLGECENGAGEAAGTAATGLDPLFMEVLIIFWLAWSIIRYYDLCPMGDVLVSS